jgi:hydrogenase expression/formation protein HypE
MALFQINHNGVLLLEKRITLSQGAGGEHMDDFIKQSILHHFDFNQENIPVSLSMLDDGAIIDDIVFSTDSHTVKPLQFPGGDIGKLAVAGTVNDVSVMGATPIALSAGFIIEEGLLQKTYDGIVKSMADSAKEAKTPIVTGDTKVVEKGAIQEFMINTSGIGRRSRYLDGNLEEVKKYRKVENNWLQDNNLSPGDKLILSGNIGEHGIALMSFREGYGFETQVQSDVAPVNGLLEKTLKIGGIVAAKDPTRGGLANTINEFSEKSNVGIFLEEEMIPIPEGVQAACDLLGLDPFQIGNEGKVIVGVVNEKAEDILAEMRKHPLGKNASIIGEVTSQIHGVVMKTSIGGKRIIPKPVGDPIPRIC